ncbi:PQQ-binding-like beta-propeller repeat protein [Halomonas nitroreducens]|uniref:Pyrrolo-quinoline quinone repeat domain-containing protein n=1 Tax=Halomonas nitroreducens TaxID=447425 RepID=A0A431V704_9GAMM|nr:PQQ-binding-like beta-propeller repeat protein [Halomonas nitroreducens]RTR06419.1 hypothetical protein EKG36_02795 [Halomonas nitroreducens]
MGRLIAGILLLTCLAARGGQADVRYPANPVVTPTAVFASHDGVVRFDRDGGAAIWRSLAGEQTFEPVPVGERLLVGTSAGLVALDAVSGDPVWRRFAGTSVFSPTVAGEVAYVAGRDGSLRALDIATGEVRWQRRFTGWVYPPALHGGVLVTGGQAAELVGLDPQSGEERWRRSLGQELVYRPVAGRHGVFVTTFAGILWAIDPADGEVRWLHRDDVVSDSPSVVGDELYLPRFDGLVQGFDQASGEGIGRYRLGSDALMPVSTDEGYVVASDGAGRVAVLKRQGLVPTSKVELSPAPSLPPRLCAGHLLWVTEPGPRLESRPLSVPNHDEMSEVGETARCR